MAQKEAYSNQSSQEPVVAAIQTAFKEETISANEPEESNHQGMTPRPIHTPQFDLDQLLSALFEKANVLTESDREKITSFIAGHGRRTEDTDADEGSLELVTLDESTHEDAETGDQVTEIIIFEMNHENGEWRKIRRKKVNKQM